MAQWQYSPASNVERGGPEPGKRIVENVKIRAKEPNMPLQASPSPLDRALPSLELAAIGPTLEAIEKLKKRRNAIILGHNYMTPDIYHGVADVVGDSLALAQEAARARADVIVMAGVHFMAETAKLLNPEKTVLIPDPRAGCSLAEAITGEDVRRLREQYPGVPVVTYVNTSAEVKAESDICCTSSNAVQIVESLGAPRVIFLPDEYLGRWVASQTDVEIILWKGHCMVHERFTGPELREYRSGVPGIRIIAHPECPPDVLEEADFVGSTAGMIDWVKQKRPEKVVMITECSMSDNVAAEVPDVEFVRPCNLCPHMKRITLEKIRLSLENMQYVVEIPDEVADRARRAVQRMLDAGTPHAARD
jgi:quinolinate synthase